MQFTPPEWLSWHSYQKLQHEDFSMFWCQSEDSLIFILMKSKHPVHIMVFGVVTSDGDIMPPSSHLALYPNIEVYFKCLEEVMLPWIQKSGCWKSNGTLYHATPAGEHSLGCEKTFVATSPNIWPPNSPDSNFLDYYVWGVVE